MYELYVLEVANKIKGVSARYATAKEDCGYLKADVIVKYNGKEFPL